MSYTPTEWKTGDIVSSQKLNHMEDGIANSENIFIVGGATLGVKGIEGTLDKTWQEIHDAILSKIGIVVFTKDNNIQQEIIQGAGVDLESNYFVSIAGANFKTSTANGYPAAEGEDK